MLYRTSDGGLALAEFRHDTLSLLRDIPLAAGSDRFLPNPRLLELEPHLISVVSYDDPTAFEIIDIDAFGFEIVDVDRSVPASPTATVLRRSIERDAWAWVDNGTAHLHVDGETRPLAAGIADVWLPDIVRGPGPIATVSYLDPPPTLTLRPLGSVGVGESPIGQYSVAIGDRGVLVRTRSDRDADAPVLTALDDDGSRRSIDLSSAGLVTEGGSGALLAYGPGDVAYFSRGTFDDFSVVAVPLSGPLAGTVAASETASINRHLEYPVSSFGHGANGVVMRRDFGTVAIEYVDVDGAPVSIDDAPPWYDSDALFNFANLPTQIHSSDGVSWAVDIEAHPARTENYAGDSLPAPTGGGDAVFWTYLGPDLDPSMDFGPKSMWVIAQLRPDGTATWWSLPDGWDVVATDVWGTVVARQVGAELELALAEFTESPYVDCTGGADPTAIVEQLVETIMRVREAELDQPISDCVDQVPEGFNGAVPACWFVCDGAERTIRVGPVNTSFGGSAPPATNEYRSINLSITYRDGGEIVDVGEGWSFVVTDDGVTLDSVSFGSPLYTRTEAVDTLDTYLGHIRRGEWRAAAAMLDDGAVNPNERPDLARLELDGDYSIESIASALERWCSAGCLTDAPSVDELVWDRWLYGIEQSGEHIRVAWFEGDRSIMGLPFRDVSP